MEAQCALLFDLLGWDWKYEPFSIMLPNGVSYTPDFFIEGHRFIIECRGYESAKGQRQIEGFCDLVSNRRRDLPVMVERYMVIGTRPMSASRSLKSNSPQIGFCDTCLMWVLTCGLQEECPLCDCKAEFNFIIECEAGQLLLNGGVPSSEWEEYINSISGPDMWMNRALPRTLRSSGHHFLAAKAEEFTSFRDGQIVLIKEGIDPIEMETLQLAVRLVQSDQKRFH